MQTFYFLSSSLTYVLLKSPDLYAEKSNPDSGHNKVLGVNRGIKYPQFKEVLRGE